MQMSRKTVQGHYFCILEIGKTCKLKVGPLHYDFKVLPDHTGLVENFVQQ